MSEPDLNLEFCCTCLKIGTLGDKFVSLNFEPPEDISYKNKLKSCVPEMGVENSEECLLCKPCSAALETAYTFRCMCLRNESRLEQFRISHKRITEKNIKQELIESCEDNLKSRKLYSVTNLTPVASVSIQPESLESNPLYPATSKSPEEIDFSSQSEEISLETDSKIEIVKDELESLLTESLGNAIDINIHIFNEQSQHSRKINSKVDIFNNLSTEMKENNSYVGKTKNKWEENKDVNIYTPVAPKKPLTDKEIIEIACKTNPDLNNCPPESLICQVTVEKIVIPKLPAPRKKVKGKGGPYWCPVCHKGVDRKERYYAHILRHSNVRAYKCDVCKRGFFSSETLSKHKKSCLELSQDINIATSSNKAEIKEKTPKRKYARRNFSKIRKDFIPIHIKKKIKIEKDPEIKIPLKKKAKIVSGITIRKSTRQHTPSKKLCNLNDTIFRCKDCNYQSYYKQKFQTHLLRHTGGKPFICTVCPKQYYEKWELNRHMRNTHSEEVKEKNESTPVPEPHFLEPAVSVIVNPGTVVTPIIQSIHSLAETSPESELIEMSFSCKVCNVSFKSADLLMLHTQTHKFKHSCEVCQEVFKTEPELLKHLQTLHEDSNESVELELAPIINKKRIRKKYFCNVCNAEFSSRDHGNIHTGAKPYNCLVCTKQFAAYTTLRKHNRTHQNKADRVGTSKRGKKQTIPQKKTFSCEICKKKFIKKEYVYSHNCQNASGDSVYRCQICKNAFIGRSALIEHMGMHVSQNENATE